MDTYALWISILYVNLNDGASILNFEGGAVEPLSHAHAIDLYSVLPVTTPEVCVKFRDRRRIPYPSKT